MRKLIRRKLITMYNLLETLLTDLNCYYMIVQLSIIALELWRVGWYDRVMGISSKYGRARKLMIMFENLSN